MNANNANSRRHNWFAAKNIFDERYIAPGNNTFVGDGFGVYVTYSLAH